MRGVLPEGKGCGPPGAPRHRPEAIIEGENCLVRRAAGLPPLPPSARVQEFLHPPPDLLLRRHREFPAIAVEIRHPRPGDDLRRQETLIDIVAQWRRSLGAGKD